MQCMQRYSFRIAFFATPPAFDAPYYGGSGRNIAILFGTEKLEWLGSRYGEKISKISLFVLTQLTNVKDTQTHKQ